MGHVRCAMTKNDGDMLNEGKELTQRNGLMEQLLSQATLLRTHHCAKHRTLISHNLKSASHKPAIL